MEWKDIKNIRGLRSVATIGSSNIIGTAITSVFWISIAGLLGTESYGELSYFLAIIGISSVIAMIGGGYTMQVYAAKGVKIESSLYFLGIIASTVAAIILFLVFENFGVSICVIGIVAFNLILFEILGKKLYKKYFKIFVGQKILFVLIASAFYFVFGTVEGILIGYGVSLLLFSQIIYKSFKNNKVNFSLIRERIKFLSHNYIAELSATARNHVDKLIIAPLLGFSFLGNYFLGLQVLAIMLIIPGIVFKYTLPEDSTGKSTGKIKILTIIVSFFIMLLGIFVAPLVIPIVLPEYAATIDLIPILSLVIIPRTISVMITSSFLGKENSKYVVIGNIITFGVLVVSLFPLAELFEITGVAIAYVIAFSSSTTYMIAKYLQLRNKNQ
jgi:O-antigen/teichoic acid export membrane protein